MVHPNPNLPLPLTLNRTSCGLSTPQSSTPHWRTTAIRWSGALRSAASLRAFSAPSPVAERHIRTHCYVVRTIRSHARLTLTLTLALTPTLTLSLTLTLTLTLTLNLTALSDAGTVNASLDKFGKIDPSTSTVLIGLLLGPSTSSSPDSDPNLNPSPNPKPNPSTSPNPNPNPNPNPSPSQATPSASCWTR